MNKLSFSITLTKQEINALWTTKCRSFVSEQPSRFFQVNDHDLDKVFDFESKKEATLYWTETFIEAKILATVLDGIVLLDEVEYDKPYCVWEPKPFKASNPIIKQRKGKERKNES